MLTESIHSVKVGAVADPTKENLIAAVCQWGILDADNACECDLSACLAGCVLMGKAR